LRVLAVDYGSRRIGLAIGDTNLKIATPIETLEHRGDILERVVNIVKERHVSLILVGLPLTPSGKEGQRAKEVRGFVEALRNLLPEDIDIIFWDERYTTEEALRLVHGLKISKKKKLKDSLSAYIILTEYLESL